MIKNNLKKYRKYKNLTQKELAKVLNISEAHVRLIENDNKYSKYQIRSRICNYFNISQDTMYYEE